MAANVKSGHLLCYCPLGGEGWVGLGGWLHTDQQTAAVLTGQHFTTKWNLNQLSDVYKTATAAAAIITTTIIIIVVIIIFQTLGKYWRCVKN